MQDDTKKYQLGNQNMGFMGQIEPNMGQNMGFMGFMDFMGREGDYHFWITPLQEFDQKFLLTIFFDQ